MRDDGKIVEKEQYEKEDEGKKMEDEEEKRREK